MLYEFLSWDLRPFELPSADLVGHSFKLVKTNYMSTFGLQYANEIITFTIPGLNGNEVQLDVKLENDSKEKIDLWLSA